MAGSMMGDDQEINDYLSAVRLGPTLLAFVSPTVLNVLVENFDIKPIGEVQSDITAMMAAGN